MEAWKEANALKDTFEVEWEKKKSGNSCFAKACNFTSDSGSLTFVKSDNLTLAWGEPHLVIVLFTSNKGRPANLSGNLLAPQWKS